MADNKSYGHKVISITLRFLQIVCASVVLGVLGKFTASTKSNGESVDRRIVYTLALSAITNVWAFATIIPYKLQFRAFPMDFALFIMWLTAFCLMETRTGIHTCQSAWFRNYWGPNWVGRHRWRVVRVDGPGCSLWRTALAFAFIASIFHAVSSAVGLYIWRTHLAKGHRKEQTTTVPKTSTSSEPRMSEVQMSEPQVGGREIV